MRNVTLAVVAALTLVFLGFKPSPKVYLQKKGGEIKFFSTAPMEDITAINHESSAILKTGDGYLKVVTPIKSFEFEKDLMFKHFLEKKYMWADKYPKAEFIGNITNISSVNFDKNGSYPVDVTGKLTIRGVEKEYTVKGTLEVKDSKVTCDAVFNVNLEDHEVPIPKMVIDNIAETVELTIGLDLDIYEKKAE